MSGVARGFLKYTPVYAVGVKTVGVARRLSVGGVFPVVHPPLTPWLAPQLTGPLFYCSGHFCGSNGANRRDSRSRIGRKKNVLRESPRDLVGRIHEGIHRDLSGLIPVPLRI